MPAARIRRELEALSCTSLDSNLWVFGHRTDESDQLAAAMGLGDLRKKFMSTKDVKAVFAKARKAGIPHKK